MTACEIAVVATVVDGAAGIALDRNADLPDVARKTRGGARTLAVSCVRLFGLSFSSCVSDVL